MIMQFDQGPPAGQPSGPAAGFVQGVVVFALYGVLAVVWLSPLSLHLTNYVYDPGDSLLNAWVLAWDWHIITTAPLSFFEANIFYPAAHSLAFSEHLIVEALMAAPVLAATNNPILAHNLVLMISFPLAGLGTYLLVKRLTGSFWAGLLAGFFFAFCPYRMMQITRLQISAIEWLPFVFLFLHRWLASRSWRDVIGLTLFYVLQGLSCGYWAMYLTVSLGLGLAVCLAFEGRWHSLRVWRQLIGFGIISALVMLPFFLPYVEVRDQMGFTRSLDEVRHYSAVVRNYFAAPGLNALWGPLTHGLGQEEAYLWPGAAALLLALWGLVMYRGSQGGHPSPRWLYLVLAGSAALFSLGPDILVFGVHLGHGPYMPLYKYVPGFDGLRTAARWGVFVMFFLSVLAGLGVAALLSRLNSRQARAVAVMLVAAALVVELWPLEVKRHGPHPVPGDLPPFVTWIAQQQGPGAVMHLPLDNPRKNSYWAYTSAFHFRPMVNGYSGFFPRGHHALAKMLANPPSPGLIEDLARAGVRWVLVHQDHIQPPGMGAAIVAAFRDDPGVAREVASWPWGHTVAFELTPPPRPQPLPPRGVLPQVSSIRAHPLNQDARLALDQDRETFWGTGQGQKKGGSFELILKRPQRIAGVELDLDHQPQRYPRKVKLELLTADKGWQPAPHATRLFPLRAVLQAPARQPAVYYLLLDEPVEVEGLRLKLQGPQNGEPWVIHELRLIPAA